MELATGIGPVTCRLQEGCLIFHLIIGPKIYIDLPRFWRLLDFQRLEK